MQQEVIEFFILLHQYFFKKLEKIKLFLLLQFVMALNYLEDFVNFIVESED